MRRAFVWMIVAELAIYNSRSAAHLLDGLERMEYIEQTIGAGAVTSKEIDFEGECVLAASCARRSTFENQAEARVRRGEIRVDADDSEEIKNVHERTPFAQCQASFA